MNDQKMNDQKKERLLGECLEEYHRRRALGEPVSAEEWREALGGHYEEFLEILAAASEIDELIEPSLPRESFPRTFGEYTLISRLGRGAMGVVYEAVQRDLGRTVALKVLRAGFEDDPQAFERFRREARACAQIRHEHVVEIYEAGQVEGRPFYAMPVLEGKSLRELVKEGKAPSPRELCRGLADIADALHALHEAGIVHRDVKPANIMVDPDGRMILADFGIARTAVAQTLTLTGQALGTPLYMSPEQLLGQKAEVDGRTDVYGLGATLYETVAGRPPFQADGVTGLMRLIMSERPPALHGVVPGLPIECSNIVMKAMEKKKADRYQSAAELRDDLRAFAEGRAVTGRPVSGLRLSLRRLRHYLLPAAAVLLVVAGLLFGYTYWLTTRPATLTLVSYPVAQVRIDGEDIGETPLNIDLSAGSHDIAFSQEGFGERSQRIDLDAGEQRTLQTALIAADPEDPRALELLGRELDVAFDRFEEAERTRGAQWGGTLEVLYPRGDVRVADLGSWRIDSDATFDIDGDIAFLRNGEDLYRAPFDPESTWEIGEIPEKVREAVRVGDTVTWGYYPHRGDPIEARFRVVADILGPRLEKIDDLLAEQEPLVRLHMRAQLFLDLELHCAALHEADRILEERPESPRGLAVKQQAQMRMGLQRTGFFTEVQKRIDDLPPEKRKQVLRRGRLGGG